MGKITRNFRQTARSFSSNLASQGYARINRMGSWYGKISNLVKVRGKAPLRQGFGGQGGNCCGKS